ncbi:uncharacterized protein LOC118449274 [Vespa mandarinia]|uniref:uncharacterized protein LOC118449274 n=1 Tax=Vespa mandarinia TaxID=7446 RepID=UPI001614D762|nr:uncharacterized protein LOC118449274 [Vespa mandarinia]
MKVQADSRATDMGEAEYSAEIMNVSVGGRRTTCATLFMARRALDVIVADDSDDDKGVDLMDKEEVGIRIEVPPTQRPTSIIMHRPRRRLRRRWRRGPQCKPHRHLIQFSSVFRAS